MIVRRLAAIVVAVAMITGAWIVRAGIDDGTDGADSVNAGVLVCVTELLGVCRAAAPDDLIVVGDEAGRTLDELSTETASPVLWLTFDGFPQMLTESRLRARLEPFALSAAGIASSPISVIARPNVSGDLVDRCGEPVDLACVAEQDEVEPLVAGIDSGIGLLSISAAFEARTGAGGSLDDDVELLPWARAFRRSSDSWQITNDTAVGAMQIRPAISVAIGAEAELVAAQRDSFEVLDTSPTTTARVVLVKPIGFDVPDGLSDMLADALAEQGWDRSASASTSLPNASWMLAVRDYWTNLS